MYLVVLIASLMIFCAVVFAYATSPYVSVFHPFTLYSLFHGVVFVIRPILAYQLDYEMIYKAYHFTPSLSDKITVIIAANLGYMSFAFFCFLRGSIGMIFTNEKTSKYERSIYNKYYIIVMVICAPVAIWSLAINWAASSDFSVAEGMITDVSTGALINTKGNGYLAEAQLMLPTLLAIFAWINRFRILTIVPFAIYIIARAGTGGRGPFVIAIAAITLLYLYDKKIKFPNFTAIISAIIIVTAFNAVGSDRGASVRAQFGEQTDIRAFRDYRLKFMEGMDFGNMEFFEYIVYVVPQRSHTYDYFLNNLQLITEPIPRVLWPSKPIGAPYQPVHLFQFGYPVGMTTSLPGLGWYSLGWLGVIIWCGLWGYILGIIYERFVRSQRGTFSIAAYCILMATMIVAFRDGSFVTIFRQGIFLFAPLGVWAIVLSLAGVRGIRGAVGPSVSRLKGQWGKVDLTLVGNLTTATSLPKAVLRRRRALALERDSGSAKD